MATAEDLLKAAFRALTRRGPSRMTLKDVAGEAGVSAAAVVQRFGSKRALLLAAARDAATGPDYIFPGVRARHRSPLAALLGLAECMSFLGSTPEAVANNLAFLQLHLDDPDFHRHARAGSDGFRAGLRALVRDAVRAGELRRCHPGRLAGALQATLNGSLQAWVVHREGPLGPWLRRDLWTVLQAYLARRGAVGRRPRAARSPPS
jgi:AcrR family transcriptional regulator